MTTKPLIVELVRYKDRRGRLGRNLYRPATEEGWKTLKILGRGGRKFGFGEETKTELLEEGINIVVVNEGAKEMLISSKEKMSDILNNDGSEACAIKCDVCGKFRRESEIHLIQEDVICTAVEPGDYYNICNCCKIKDGERNANSN